MLSNYHGLRRKKTWAWPCFFERTNKETKETIKHKPASKQTNKETNRPKKQTKPNKTKKKSQVSSTSPTTHRPSAPPCWVRWSDPPLRSRGFWDRRSSGRSNHRAQSCWWAHHPASAQLGSVRWAQAAKETPEMTRLNGHNGASETLKIKDVGTHLKWPRVYQILYISCRLGSLRRVSEWKTIESVPPALPSFWCPSSLFAMLKA